MDIKNEFNKLFISIFSFKQEILIEENLDKNLFLEPFFLKPVELLYLFFEIEKIFNFKINEEIIISRQFNTINAIYDVLSKLSR